VSADHEFQPENQCTATPLGGGRCELDTNHEGKHTLHFPGGGVFSWTRESQLELVKRFEEGR
jgi:hypothetical protein